MTDEKELAIANEVLELLRERGVRGGATVTMLASVILVCIEQLAIDPQDAVAGVEALAKDMVEGMKEAARASAN